MKAILFLLLAVFASGCSSGPEVKRQQYAVLQNSKDFEEDYKVVWKSAVEALSEYKVEKMEEDDGILRTDWVTSTSTEKYFEYKVNGFPRKKYLQVRYKIDIALTKKLGSVNVAVNPHEQVEQVKDDGSFSSWTDSDQADSSRASDILSKIELKILQKH